MDPIVKTKIFQTNRAQYGKQTVKLLSQRLTTEFGKGFSNSSLTQMVKFYEQFPDNVIVATVPQKLSWSHFVELIKL